MTRLAAALLLSAALLAPASARECLTQREFRATEHKVKLRAHCWAAVAQKPKARPAPAEVEVVHLAPAEFALVEPPEPAAEPEPDSILAPGLLWRSGGDWPVVARKGIPDALIATAGAILALGSVGGLAGFLGHRRKVRVRDAQPMDPGLMPVVLRGGVRVHRRAF